VCMVVMGVRACCVKPLSTIRLAMAVATMARHPATVRVMLSCPFPHPAHVN
jgi:BarA-like signal transduction histidine kinase